MTIKKLIGSDPSQISRNRDLGTLAFQNSQNAVIENLSGSVNMQILSAGKPRASVRPSVMIDFVGTKKLDKRLHFRRPNPGWYYDDSQPVVASQNILAYSQDFTKGDWVTGAVVQRWTKVGIRDFSTGSLANTTTAPDGTTTASLIMEDTSTGFHAFYQYTADVDIGANTQDIWCWSVFIKNYSSNRYIRISLSNGNGSFCYINVDPIDGSIVQKGDRRDYYRLDGLNSGVTSVGSGWYRVWVSARCRFQYAWIIFCDTRAANIQEDTNYGRVTYTGNGTAGLYIWGAQGEQAASPGPYIATTELPVTNRQPVLKIAEAYEPRFNHDPITRECKGLLIEKGKFNEFFWSEDFTKSTWTKTNSSMVAPFTGRLLITGSAMSPDGTFGTNYLQEDGTASAAHAISCTVSVLNDNFYYTMSVYAKAKERTWLRFDAALSLSTSYNVWFDLANGQVGTELYNTGTGITAGGRSEIENVGNGWYRCKLFFRAPLGTTGTFSFGLATGNGNTTFNGTGAAGLYLWGAQLEMNRHNVTQYEGPLATSYFKTRGTRRGFYGDYCHLAIGPTYDPGGAGRVSWQDSKSSWYNEYQGTVLTEYRESTNNNQPFIGVMTANNTFYGSGKTTNLRVYRATDYNPYAAFSSASVSYSGYADRGGFDNLYGTRQNYTSMSFSKPFKVALAWRENDVAWTINGDPPATLIKFKPLIPFTVFTIGGDIYDSLWYAIDGHVTRFVYYPQRLSNAELQGITFVDRTD